MTGSADFTTLFRLSEQFLQNKSQSKGSGFAVATVAYDRKEETVMKTGWF
jgi:hypothetical protein